MTLLDQILANPCFKSLNVNALKRRVSGPAVVESAYAELNGQTGSSVLPSVIIDHDLVATLFLVQSGTFVLGKDITWTTAIGNYSAIVIMADNVTLDLNGHSITCVFSDAGVKRSTINTSGFSNVTIKNGTLINSCYCGINANATKGLTLENVTIQKMTYQAAAGESAYPAGVTLSNCNGVTLTNVNVSDVQVTAETAAGILMTKCQNSTITGGTLGTLANANGSMQGFSPWECESLKVAGLSVTGLTTDSIAGQPSSASTAIGFMPTGCIGVSLVDCKATNILGCCDDCHGMSVFVCTDVTVQGFQAHHVHDGRPPYNKGAKATGLEVYGFGVAVTNCQVSDIVANNPEDLQSSGFSVWGDGIQLTGCTASEVSIVGTPPEGQAYYAVGFGWAPDPRPDFCIGDATNVTYTSCTANNCTIGFDTFRHVNSRWETWSTTGCATPVLQSSAARTLTCCPCSECNPPISAQVPNTATDNSFSPPAG